MFDISDVIQGVEDLADLNFNELPSMTFIQRLRDCLVDKYAFSRESANEIALAMDVKLGNVEITDAQMNALVAAFAKIVDKVAKALQTNGFPSSAVVSVATRFNLKMS